MKVRPARTDEDVVAQVTRDRVFYRNSGDGVTVSGGEPLAQPEFAGAVLRACRQADLHTALETSGYAAWETLALLLDAVDVLLYDVKIMDPVRHRQFTGVESNLEQAARRVPTIARVPLIPGVNDDVENCRAMAAFLCHPI